MTLRTSLTGDGCSLRVRKREETRRALVGAAYALVRDAGYAGLTAEGVADRARVSRRTFFNYYPTKAAALFDPDPDDADRLAAHLKAEGVLTDARRGTLLRLAPFVWNGSDDVARAFDVLGHALRTGAHRAAVLDRSGPVT